MTRVNTFPSSWFIASRIYKTVDDIFISNMFRVASLTIYIILHKYINVQIYFMTTGQSAFVESLENWLHHALFRGNRHFKWIQLLLVCLQRWNDIIEKMHMSLKRCTCHWKDAHVIEKRYLNVYYYFISNLSIFH